jgi:hypothetical protein
MATKKTTKDTAADSPKLSAAGPTPPQKPADINPFELEGLVVRPAYKTPTGMASSVAAIPVRDKAGPATFFMVHPNPEYAQDLHVIKWSEEGDESRGEWYVVHPNVARIIEDDPVLKLARIYYCISQTGYEFLVVVPLNSGAKSDTYSSKHAVFEAARSRFLKMQWVSGAMQWVYRYAETDGPETPPAWTDETYLSILKRGFNSPKQDRYISSADHEVMRSLRGLRVRG